MTEWVVARRSAATHSDRFAATSPIKGEEKTRAGAVAFGIERNARADGLAG